MHDESRLARTDRPTRAHECPDSRGRIARLANLLGATALAVTDLALGGATDAAGTSSSGAAALVVLHADPGISVTELGRRVGLTQSAAARMVDALEQRGLVERRSTVGRWVAVHPTHAGRAAATALLDARGGRLTALVGELPADERAALTRILERLLRAVYGEVGSAERVCRLCDRATCTDDAVCPVGQAERDLSGG
jgi:MarR family transcriptional regulator, negative regulator of the multidrug operon emrRAB